jgi:hypothetical protein
VKRLTEHRRTITAGITDRDERRERIRFAILEGGLEMTIIGRHPTTKKPETYAQAFERYYGEALEPKQRKGKRHAQSRSA